MVHLSGNEYLAAENRILKAQIKGRLFTPFKGGKEFGEAHRHDWRGLFDPSLQACVVVFALHFWMCVQPLLQICSTYLPML